MKKTESKKKTTSTKSDPAFHDLKPTIWVGKQGVTDTILTEIRTQIKTRSLIKIKWLASVEIHPDEIAAATKTDLLQVRGRTMVLRDRRSG